ncbi:MAG: transposase [Oligoflexia bacterium]|nr:transposase [Oligoflexia bacterium]
MLPRYGGIIVDDCWATYLSYKNLDHGLCGGHIVRELRYVIECDGNGWALMMMDLLIEAADVVGSRTTSILTSIEYQGLVNRYREILNEALDELPPFPDKKDDGKGRPKHTDAQNLWLRLKEYESSVLLFATVKEVEFTNNRAERDIRGSKTKQIC